MSLIASNLCLKPDTEHHLNDVCFEMSKGEIQYLAHNLIQIVIFLVVVHLTHKMKHGN